MSSVELVDREFGQIGISLFRKIKFKQVSFTNISNRFTEFRSNLAKKEFTLDNKGLVSMEFQSDQLVPENSHTIVEEKVLKSTMAIANLESRIKFLEISNYVTEEFIDSRAIKLKDTMMKNLGYNIEALYGTDTEVKDTVMGTQGLITPENFAVSTDDIVGESDAEEQAVGIDQEETEKPIDADELALAINEELEKIKVSQNESTPAKVQKFTKEDETAPFKGESIADDYRVTGINRDAFEQMFSQQAEQTEIPEITPFENVTRNAPSMNSPRKSITPLDEVKKYEFPPISLPKVKDSFYNEISGEETIERETIAIAPERNAINLENKKTQGENLANPELSEDVQAYFNKVTVLTKDLGKIQTEYANEADDAQETTARYNETINQFAGYANELETKCNETYQALQQMRRDKNKQEEQISMMISLMAQGIGQ